MTSPTPSGGKADAALAKAKFAQSMQSVWIGAPMLAIELGISSRTLDRWLHDAALRFPQPHYVNGRKFFDRAEIDAWRHGVF